MEKKDQYITTAPKYDTWANVLVTFTELLVIKTELPLYDSSIVVGIGMNTKGETH